MTSTQKGGMGSRKGLFILGFYFTESLIVNLQHLLVKPADRQTKYVNYADREGQNIPKSVYVIYGCPLCVRVVRSLTWSFASTTEPRQTDDDDDKDDDEAETTTKMASILDGARDVMGNLGLHICPRFNMI